MKTKQLLNQLDNFLMKYKIYRWCKKEDVQAHFYILLITMYATTMTSYYWLSSIPSFLIGLLVSVLVMAGREYFNKSGWSWMDIFNGGVGVITATVASALTVMVINFIKIII